MAGEPTIEATGETVGEAKWAALRELEHRFPGLDRQAVSFQVLAEGERGLMGIGREPARVVATLAAVPGDAERAAAAPTASEPPPARRPAPPPPPLGDEADDELANETRRILRAVVHGLHVDARVHVGRRGDDVVATLSGDDLGVLIGKHGHTIDALQYLLNAMLARGEAGTGVIVDAQNYRQRRELVLHETAARAARDAVRLGRPVSLEPMSSVERKIVHLALQDDESVETGSDGREPHRHVVVSPRTAEPAAE